MQLVDCSIVGTNIMSTMDTYFFQLPLHTLCSTSRLYSWHIVERIMLIPVTPAGLMSQLFVKTRHVH